jgi:hypothetical protein
MAVRNDGEGSEGSPMAAQERSEADKLVDKINFSELCNEFECVSSPYVESTARQLARDILEMREANRTLATFAVSVKYKVAFFWQPLQFLSNIRWLSLLRFSM